VDTIIGNIPPDLPESIGSVNKKVKFITGNPLIRMYPIIRIKKHIVKIPEPQKIVFIIDWEYLGDINLLKLHSSKINCFNPRFWILPKNHKYPPPIVTLFL